MEVLIPERKKFKLYVAAMEQKNYNRYYCTLKIIEWEREREREREREKKKKKKKNYREFQYLTDRHVSFWFQKEHPSSRLKSTPPIGAPKAAKWIQSINLNKNIHTYCIEKKNNFVYLFLSGCCDKQMDQK